MFRVRNKWSQFSSTRRLGVQHTSPHASHTLFRTPHARPRLPLSSTTRFLHSSPHASPHGSITALVRRTFPERDAHVSRTQLDQGRATTRALDVVGGLHHDSVVIRFLRAPVTPCWFAKEIGSVALQRWATVLPAFCGCSVLRLQSVVTGSFCVPLISFQSGW